MKHKHISFLLGMALLVASCGAGGSVSSTTTEPQSTSIIVKEYKDGVVAYFVADVKLAPGSGLGTVVAEGKTSRVARQNGAWFAVNGDYFLHRDNGVIVRNGVLVVDEPKRDGMAITKDGIMVVYEETPNTSGFLEQIHAIHAFSFGPILVNNWEIPADVGEYYEVDTGRSINGKHPRTGVCMVEPNHFKFIVVDGRKPGYSKGATLVEFAKLFIAEGCQIAYNLDGGGSSVMYKDGQIVNRPLGTGKERNNGDFIFVHHEA